MSVVEQESPDSRSPSDPQLEPPARSSDSPAPDGDAANPEPPLTTETPPAEDEARRLASVAPEVDDPAAISSAPVIAVARMISVGGGATMASEPSAAPPAAADPFRELFPPAAPVLASPAPAFADPADAPTPFPFPDPTGAHAPFADSAAASAALFPSADPAAAPTPAGSPAGFYDLPPSAAAPFPDSAATPAVLPTADLDAAASALEGSFERYQRRFVETEGAGAPEKILAALDARVHSPSNDQAAPPTWAPPIQAHEEGTTSALPSQAQEERHASAVPIQAHARHAAQADEPLNLDIDKDVDWGEAPPTATELLGRVAAAIPLAEAHPASGSPRESVRPAHRASARAPVAARADHRVQSRARGHLEARGDDDQEFEGRSDRHSSPGTWQRARRPRSEATSAVLILSFVASVILALGTGFVAGFVVGRGSPSAAQERAEEAREPEAKAKRVQSAVEDPPAGDELEIVKNPSQAAAHAAPSAGAAPAAVPFAGNKPNRAAAEPKVSFDQKSVAAALSKAQARAGLCVQPGEPGGTAVVTVTFDESGAASNAAVYGARFSGTPAGECIVKMLRELKVRPFTGDPITVKKTISVE